MSLRNETYKGVTSFLLELRKHLTNGVAGSFWREISGRTAWVISFDWKDKHFHSLQDLVNFIYGNHKDISDEDYNYLLMQLPSIHWVLERKSYFMLEVMDAPLDTPSATDKVDDEPAVVKQEDNAEVDLTKLSVSELRKMCEDKGIKFHPAAKQGKLIELLSK